VNLRTIARRTAQIALAALGVAVAAGVVILIAGASFATGIYIAIQMVD
jgi:hypothetical protein